MRGERRRTESTAVGLRERTKVELRERSRPQSITTVVHTYKNSEKWHTYLTVWHRY
jgi:hypothetical protein